MHTYMAPLCCYSTCPAWLQQNHPGIRNYFSISSRTSHARSLISSSGTRKSGVFVLSDLHTDYSDNMSWVRSLKSRSSEDVLLVAGDVAETYSNFVLTMSLLKDKFHRVFFVPGNHDLWLRKEKADHLGSLDKLDKLLDACQRLGVETKPGIVDGLGVIPLYSWYHESFDGERNITGVRIPSLEMACKDFHVCKWPNELQNEVTSLAMYFDSLNDKNWDIVKDIQKRCSHIISFSHFVPRQELCPEKRMLFYPNLPKIIGSNYIENRIRCIHGAQGSPSACHVFGHTHFCWDAILDGIRYVQAPLAYPRERERKMNGGEEWLPFCIYRGGYFADKHSPCYWSDYYSMNPRTPDIIELAPWVASGVHGLRGCTRNCSCCSFVARWRVLGDSCILFGCILWFVLYGRGDAALPDQSFIAGIVVNCL